MTKIELTEIHEGAWIELKDVKRLSWKAQKEITSALVDESISSNLDVAERLSIALIKGGYLLDDENRPISFPLTPETIGNVPALVVEKVASKFAELKAASVPNV
jgi:hypothetical protein